MTYAEMEAADAEYDALPGTPPDGYSFIPESDLKAGFGAVQERIRAWEPEMTFARLTDMTGELARDGWPDGVWLEVWKIEPRKPAPFNPPLVAAPLDEREEAK